MKIGIVVFPGSNCDHDCYRAIQKVTQNDPVFLWHKDSSLQNCDAVILPGGFSYGDYLRAGAIARNSPLMKEIVLAAQKGLPILGICNGFQILTESHLLPGTLMRNENLHFVCKNVSLKLQNTNTPFTQKGEIGKAYQIPIAHGEGNYQIDEDGLKTLQDQDQIVFTYCEDNPNGSVDNIAGIKNKAGNVMGMMPHPERVCEDLLGGKDGRFIFESLLSS